MCLWYLSTYPIVGIIVLFLNAERNELAARKGTVRGRHSKLQSKQMDAEELGVKPLPRTPQALQRPRFSKILTEVAKTRDTQEPSSFAPSDFTFEFNVSDDLYCSAVIII